MTRYVVCEVTELPPGSKRIVEVGGRSIGVYNVSGEYFALRNVCPHQGGPLCSGMTTALVTSDGPGNFIFEREGEIVRCPWHQWEFDIRTGYMVVDPAMRIKTYDVTVERYNVSTDAHHIFVHL